MYLYIFEDGVVAQFDQGPTDADDQSMSDGILQVLKVDTDLPFIEISLDGPTEIPFAVRLQDEEGYEFTCPLTDPEIMEACGWKYAQ